MEIVVSSLSSNNQLVVASLSTAPVKQELTIPKHELQVREALTFYQTITSYSLPTAMTAVTADGVEVTGFNDHLPKATHPLVASDRNKALDKINALLLDINKLKKDFQIHTEGPICPYEQMKLEYLGPNFIVPSIHDLAIPQNFSAENATTATLTISKKYNDTMLTGLQQMTAEAAETSFPGITSEHLGNAFAVLSATAAGDKYVVDKHKAALHIEFAELVRNISVDDIIEDPLVIAQKLITRYVEINHDYLQQRQITPLID